MSIYMEREKTMTMKSMIKITRQGCDEYAIECGRVRVLEYLRRRDLESIRDQVAALLAEHDGKDEPPKA